MATVRYGERSENVGKVQAALNAQPSAYGLPRLVVDKAYGAMTAEAVRTFRAIKGLSDSRDVDETTWILLGLAGGVSGGAGAGVSAGLITGGAGAGVNVGSTGSIALTVVDMLGRASVAYVVGGATLNVIDTAGRSTQATAAQVVNGARAVGAGVSYAVDSAGNITARVGTSLENLLMSYGTAFGSSLGLSFPIFALGAVIVLVFILDR
jgi:peptidoglycan hydrolase-like protein with peptidoglycan-binding domain